MGYVWPSVGKGVRFDLSRTRLTWRLRTKWLGRTSALSWQRFGLLKRRVRETDRNAQAISISGEVSSRSRRRLQSQITEKKAMTSHRTPKVRLFRDSVQYVTQDSHHSTSVRLFEGNQGDTAALGWWRRFVELRDEFSKFFDQVLRSFDDERVGFDWTSIVSSGDDAAALICRSILATAESIPVGMSMPGENRQQTIRFGRRPSEQFPLSSHLRASGNDLSPEDTP